MPVTHDIDILIIGAGFSGLIMAMEARKRGFDDIVILEKADDIGGTWRENTYPGVACDVPSHLYSFASHLNPDWSTSYAGGAEIWQYMKDVARRESLYDLCRFGQTMQSARWTGTRWQVTTAQGDIWSARILVSGMGALHVPLIPDIPGIETFQGPSFHSAQWQHDVDLTGKRVAVIGTGASAVQFVPAIAQKTAELTIFQRTAPYVLPRPDGPIKPWVRDLYRRVPILPAIRRRLIYALFELRHATFLGKPRAVNFAMKMWRKELHRSIKDPAFQQALTPPYRIGCKRILNSNDWYPAVARDNVTVLQDGVASVQGNTLTSVSGQQIDADVVIWGTGFHVTDAMDQFDITGEDGLALAQVWADGLQAHLGTALAGFPNLFFLLGPHTGLGHNSVVLMIEAQADHIGRLLDTMRSQGTEAIAPRPDAQQAFEAEMDDRLASTVWQNGGCTSWYQDKNGRNPTLWPGTVTEYRKRMATADIAQYAVAKRPSEPVERPAP